MNRLLSVSGAARELGISPHTARYHVLTGALRATRLSNGWRVVRRHDLEQFKAARESRKSRQAPR